MIRILKLLRSVTLVASAALFYLQPVSAHSRLAWVDQETSCVGEADDAYCDWSCRNWNYPGITCDEGYCSLDFYTCLCDCVPAN